MSGKAFIRRNRMTEAFRKGNDMFEKNTKQINQLIAKIFAVGAVAIVIMAIGSFVGFFDFGTRYTLIVLIAGLFVTIVPSILIRILPDRAMVYYMLITLSIFIGVLGTNNRIGIYMTYALVPIFSCLYFDPRLVVKSSIFSYIIMAAALYINSKHKYEVIYEGMSHIRIFIAYLMGFTIEYLLINSILYYMVKRARQMMEDRYSAEEENRMKTRFLSTMSHELRTPMNAVIGMADVALREEMNDNLRKCISIIKSSSVGLLEIVNDVLDLSKIEAGKLMIIIDAYTTDTFVNDIMAIIDARNIEGKVPIYYHIQKGMPEVLEGDAVRIKQVMLNLASNAIKYTEQGQIDITITCEDRQDGYADLTFTVKDTGEGIRTEDMDKLFSMYSQFDAEKNHGKEGTGIGLAISKYYIDQMGGTIDVESTYGKGSTFSFVVPQKIEDARTAVLRKEQRTAETNEDCLFRTQNTRVLLVDDNEMNREVVKAILEPLALTIDEAENGQVAVQMAKQSAYDLIFMDSHMPVMNGEEATIYIRRMENSPNQNVPIIAITADAVAGVRERLLDCGMNDYIMKPIDIEAICGLIRKYLPPEKIVG